MLNRLILWVALAGMVLALHLWVQKARDFDQGCLGLLKPEMVVTDGPLGCREVSELPASHLLGVSNAAWGYALYFAVAMLSFAKILARADWARRLHALSEALVAVAFAYSAYLVFQMAAVVHAWCVLCLLSAGLVTVLFGLHVALRARGGYQPVDASSRVVELGWASGGTFAMAGLLVGVLMFVDRLGTRPLGQGDSGRELRRLVGRILPLYIEETKLQEMRPTRFEWTAPRLELANFVRPGTPFIGDAAALRVVLFVDPNCPHCREYFPEFMAAAEQLKSRAGFTVLPRVLWSESIPQVAALRLAEGSGKYFELWRAMFERQPGPRRGLSVAQIAALFQELGLDAGNLEQRIAAERPAIGAAQAAARVGGIDHAPAVYFESRQVWSASQDARSLRILVERVRSGEVPVK